MKKLTKKAIASRLARRVEKLLKNKNIEVVTVTGSIGKTSTKVAIGKLLSNKYQVRFSEDSYNTDIGLPLSFFGLKAPGTLWDPLAWRRVFQKISSVSKHYPYDVVVLEMADDEVDDMTNLLKVIKPNIGVVTAVAPVHMERMVTMDRVVKDNWKIANAAKQVVYNADFKELKNLALKSKKATGYGLKNGSIKMVDISRNKQGYLIGKLVLPEGKFDLNTKMIGEQNLGALLAAATVADRLGMPGKDIAKGLARIEPVNGRMKLLKGINGSNIIDDSYNASPEAVKAALAVFEELTAKQRIAVLGNMNELGSDSKNLHYQIGQVAAKVADMLIVIGKDAEIHMVAGAKEAGMSADKIKIFKTPYEIGHFLKRIVKKGDLMLIKGSQNGVFLEETSRILLDPALKPNSVLVRQSKSWRRKKRKAFGL
jgi:UDP-N-acetylmuramoyl-tripeptide--D-alanyl-D-alanine ligase